MSSLVNSTTSVSIVANDDAIVRYSLRNAAAAGDSKALEQIVSYYASHLPNGSLIVKLARCESRFKNICIIDVNGKWSCGLWQFQKATFYQYCPTENWHDPFDQMDCVRQMIQLGRLKFDWANSAIKIGKGQCD